MMNDDRNVERDAAVSWAFKQRAGCAVDQHILLVLASEVKRGTFIASPGVKRISEITGLDRKTVMRGLARVQEQRLIEEGGERTGATKQLKAYRLRVLDDDLRVSSGYS